MERKVLLVDDDKSLRETFIKGLAAYSDTFTVLAAKDGQEAVELLEAQDIYLVITDLKMPRMDGFALLSHIIEHYPEIPVIVITGYGTPQMKKLAQKSGAVGYIEKPFMIEDLAESILSHLRKISEGGTLHNVSSGMFLQLIEMEEKTCTIRVSDKQTNNHGVLYFLNGQLLDAKMNRKRAEEAAYEILSWDDVSITIQNSCSIKEGPIKGDVQSILMEAMRRKDEGDGEESRDEEDTEDIVEVSEAGEKEKDLPPEDTGKEEMKSVPAEELAEEVNPIDELRSKIQSVLHDKTGLKDIYEDSEWNTLIKRFQALGTLFDAGNLKVTYLDRGGQDDLVLVPGRKNITVVLNPKCPRDKIIQVISK